MKVLRWKDQPLRYYQKYRFYYQPYVPDHHIISVPRQGWGIAAAGVDGPGSNGARNGHTVGNDMAGSEAAVDPDEEAARRAAKANVAAAMAAVRHDVQEQQEGRSGGKVVHSSGAHAERARAYTLQYYRG